MAGRVDRIRINFHLQERRRNPTLHCAAAGVQQRPAAADPGSCCIGLVTKPLDRLRLQLRTATRAEAAEYLGPVLLVLVQRAPDQFGAG